ncbi:inositol polyphosphate 5-phosphatase, putative, partial [Entamoeba invadens IP1]
LSSTNTQYIPLGYYQLCGVVIYVFHNERLKDKISDVGFGDCRVGAMSGTLANKGGVAYRMKIYDSTVCFVVSHLAAHQHFLERRYQDWTEISKMKITYLDTQTSQPKKVGLLDHDVVVWMGDLNFRIDLSDGDVRKLLRTKNYIELAKKDQLLTAMKKKIIFQKFNEASLTFAPTFKVKIGEEDCVYEENRIPSWCDRVLWKCENGHYVQSMSYMSHEIYTSDHKPVSSILSLNLQEIDHNKKTEVLTYLEKVAMKYEETTRPNVHVENDEILFEGVELFATYTKTVTLKNCGKFGVSYEFEETEDCIYTHDWLTIKQCEGFIDILEGRDSIKIPLTVCITEEIAWMSQDRNFMTQELWVRLGDGKERIKFTVRVRSRVSLIGMRLETLNRLAKPLIGNSKMVMKKIPFQVPKEIYRLVDWIYKKYSVGCFERGETKYTKEEMKSLVDVLSLNAEFQSERVGLCCECLLFFLANLHDAIVSIECGIIDNDMLLMQKIKFQTPDEQRILFLYILCFCKKLIELGEKLETISSRFTKALFRDADQVTLKKLKKFIERLLIGKDQFSLSIYQN